MYTIKKQYNANQIINKSEFICNLYPVSNIGEINEILTNIRKKYFDATHNCYAYILGNNGDIIKFSDDGEPSQTAGIVIYDCLKKKELTNCLAIVTRYFGGIKLGAGGLVRAYSSSTAKTLENIEVFKLTMCLSIEIKCSYIYLNKVLKEMEKYTIENKLFLDDIYLEYLIPKDDYDSVYLLIESLSRKTAIITIKNEIMKAF